MWCILGDRRIDTIKIIDYRAETAMVQVVREQLNAHHQDEARALIRDICTTPADLPPDPTAKTLTVSLHSLATPKNNAAVAHLCAELKATETIYPGTDLRMIFKSVSSSACPKPGRGQVSWESATRPGPNAKHKPLLIGTRTPRARDVAA